MNSLISEQSQEELTSRLEQPKLILQGELEKTMTVTQLMKNGFFKIPSGSPNQHWAYMMPVKRLGKEYILTVVYKQLGEKKAVCMGRLRYTTKNHRALKCHM
jgi:hypothetical protein